MVKSIVRGENTKRGHDERNLTSGSIRPRDSNSFIVALSHHIEGCSRGAAHPRRSAASATRSSYPCACRYRRMTRTDRTRYRQSSLRPHTTNICRRLRSLHSQTPCRILGSLGKTNGLESYRRRLLQNRRGLVLSARRIPRTQLSGHAPPNNGLHLTAS